MKPYCSAAWLGKKFFSALVVFLFVTVNVAFAATDAKKPPASPPQITHYHLDDPHTRAAFDYFYNLDYKHAIHEFELALQAHPNDATAVNHLLSGILFQELYRVGALDSELYAKEGFLKSKQYPTDSATKQRIVDLTNRALELSEERLNKNPNDVDALYSRGVTRGLKSTYTALVEKAWFSALRSAVGARHDHERVLELQPDYTDAKMIVGMHNYVIGSVSWAVKVAASIVGLSGSRKKGIDYLYEAANGGGEAAVDAKIALALFLRREQRYSEAIKLIDGLNNSYPKNFLMALELANLYNAAGRAPESIASYEKLLKNAEAGSFPDAHIEMAWYGLGEAQRGQHNFKAAEDAYEKVLTFSKTDPDLRLRATLGAGEMCDVLQQRNEAIKHYNSILAQVNDSPQADEARRYLKDPYRI